MKKNAIAFICASVLAVALLLPAAFNGAPNPASPVANIATTQSNTANDQGKNTSPDNASTNNAATAVSSGSEGENEAWGETAGGNPPNRPEYVPGEMIVKLGDGVTVDQLNERLAELDYVATKSVSEDDVTFGYVELQLAEGVSVEDATARVADERLIGAAQPNYAYYLQDESPVDRAYAAGNPAGGASNDQTTNASSPALHAGSGSFDTLNAQSTIINDAKKNDLWGLEAVHAYEAWDTARVEGSVVVAVLDSGVNAEHEDLVGRVLPGYNAKDESSDVSDTYGHGTHVSGIIAATANNEKGVAGVSYNAKILPAKVMDGQATSTTIFLKGIEHVASLTGEDAPKIMNISIGTNSDYGSSTDNALKQAMDKAHDKGMMAAPYVAGTAGLVYAANPDLEAWQVKKILEETANGAIGSNSEGWDDDTGYGLVDAAAAVKAAAPDAAPTIGGSDSVLATRSVSLSVSGATTRTWTWTSSNDAIASVASGTASASGGGDASTGEPTPVTGAAVKVTGVSEGNATITATSDDDIVLMHQITVGPVPTYTFADAIISLSFDSMLYTGSALKPSVTAKIPADKNGGQELALVEGEDFQVEYFSNTNASTDNNKATIAVIGKGNYQGTAQGTFTIGAATITKVQLSQSKYAYTGSACSPTVTVYGPKDGQTDQVLTEGTDYTLLTTEGRANAGDYTYSVTPIGNYGGSPKKAKMTIEKASLSQAKITLAQSAYTFDGTAKTPDVTVMMGDKKLTKGVDFLVSYSNNIYAGTATAMILPVQTGNYTDMRTMQFKINAASSGGSGSSGSGSSSAPKNASVQYNTHVQNIGWQGWRYNGAMSGTSGRALRLEAIQIELTGAAASRYDVYYRVHCQNIGWMGWAKNGASAGTAGYSYRLEAIQIKLVPKGGAAPGSTANSFRQR